MFQHPDAKRNGNLGIDVAVMKLESPLEYTDWVQPIEMPSMNSLCEKGIFWVQPI